MQTGLVCAPSVWGCCFVKQDYLKRGAYTADKGYGSPSQVREHSQRLLDDITALQHYKTHAEPYNIMPLDEDLDTLKTYWKTNIDCDQATAISNPGPQPGDSNT